jgi:hypothetical protein
MQMMVVDSRPITEIMEGPAGAAFQLYAVMHAEATKSAGTLAQANRIPLPEFVGGMTALALQYLAWSMLSAAKHGSAEFDPVEFGKAAERIARETVPAYAQAVERAGAAQQ